MTLRLREGIKLDNDKIVTMLNHLSISLEILLDRPTQQKEVAAMSYNADDVQRLVKEASDLVWGLDRGPVTLRPQGVTHQELKQSLAPFQTDPEEELRTRIIQIFTGGGRVGVSVDQIMCHIKESGWTPPKS